MTANARNLPILIGEDRELSNFIEGCPNSGARAARLMLPEFGGATGYWSTRIASDSGRHWSHFCAYEDMTHTELCIPEVTSPFDYLVYSNAALLRLRRSLSQLNARRAGEGKAPLHVLATNTDGRVSWGAHLNFGVPTDLFDRLLSRSLHLLLYLASFKVSSIVITGQGAVDSEGKYLLSQRADFFVQILSEITTANRGIINTRDEPLCAAGNGIRRKHTIFYDSNLCEWAAFLKVGMLALLFHRMSRDPRPCDIRLILDDPVASLHRWNRDPESPERLADGRRVTAFELQRLFAEEAERYVSGPDFDETTCPYGGTVVSMWRETLGHLKKHDTGWLSRRLDWALKKTLCERALDSRPELSWDSPGVRMLADKYASLGEDGIFQAVQRDGGVERLTTDEEIDRATGTPPSDTRAWTRSHLLRLAGDQLETADWDSLSFRLPDPRRNRWVSRIVRVSLDDPFTHTRDEFPDLEYCSSLAEAIDYVADPDPHPVSIPATAVS